MTSRSSNTEKRTNLQKNGRPARIAQLVAHDVFKDARVLKEAGSALEAGAQVKIITRALPGSIETDKYLSVEGKPVVRIPGFSMYSALPESALKKLRKAAGTSADTGTEVRQDTATQHTAENSDGQVVSKKQHARTNRTSSQKVFKLMKDGGYRVANLLDAPVGLASWWSRVVTELRTAQPDLIHCNDANTLVPGYIASKVLKVPFVYDSHELWLHRATRKHRIIAPHVEAVIEKVTVPAAAGVTTVSQSIADWLAKEYALTVTPTVVRNVPKAIENVPGRLRSMAGLSSSDRIISFSGGLNSTRGIDVVVKALAHLPANTHFVMLGFGTVEYLDELNELAKSIGVENRIHVVGPVKADEVAGTLSDSDVAYVYLKPDCLNHKFALPNKLFEAIAAGLPVVASNLPEISKLVTSYGVGQVFDGEDPVDLAAAIEVVLGNGQNFRDAAKKARKDLNWDYEAEGLIQLYDDVLREMR